MKRYLCAATLLAAACSPSDVLSNQGSTLRNTDFVQMGIEQQRKKQAEEDAKRRVQETEQAHINKVAQSAQAHVDLFEYPAAISDWKEAYRLSTNPVYMLRIGESQRAIGQCDEAQAMYQQYLDKTAGDGTDAALARTRLDAAK